MNLEQQFSEKLRKALPRRVVQLLKSKRVVSVCMQSFPKACQVASSKRRSRMIVLYGSGRRPSKTGIAHCQSSQKLKNKNV